VKGVTLRFLLLVLLVPIVTFPGSITFANWDAPYGFYKDLSTWLGSTAGGWLVLLVYEAWHLRKERARAQHLLALALLIVLTAIAGYRAELALHGENGFGSGSLLNYVVGGLIGFVLSLMLLPLSLPYVITGDVYPYDRPLVVAWLVLVVAFSVLIVLNRKTRERKLETAKNHSKSQDYHHNREGLL